MSRSKFDELLRRFEECRLATEDIVNHECVLEWLRARQVCIDELESMTSTHNLGTSERKKIKDILELDQKIMLLALEKSAQIGAELDGLPRTRAGVRNYLPVVDGVANSLNRLA